MNNDEALKKAEQQLRFCANGETGGLSPFEATNIIDEYEFLKEEVKRLNNSLATTINQRKYHRNAAIEMAAELVVIELGDEKIRSIDTLKRILEQ